jgi:Ca2+-binding RTX toxin-like protein
MSTLINTYFLNAQLSMAAYANLRIDMTPTEYKDALKGAGFTEALATDFVQNYSILSVSPSSLFNLNGFSATLFQNNSTGEKVLAIRGTNLFTFGDVITDLTLGLLGDVSGQYNSLKDYYDSLTSSGMILSTDTLTVTGHSLGGFLAEAFTVDHPLNVSHTYTYNAPGVGGVVIDLLQAIGVIGSTIPTDLITNVIAQGPSFIASTGSQVGTAQNIFIETSPFLIPNHFIGRLVDSLALYDVFATIDPTLSTDTITSILQEVSNTPFDSLEKGLDAFRKLFLDAPGNTKPADREAYYTNLLDLKTNVPAGDYRVLDLTGLAAGTLTGFAHGSLAYRYALVELNPFVVIGADYTSHNTRGELDRFDEATGLGTLTDDYLADRAQFLAQKLALNSTDSGPSLTATAFFHDIQSGYKIAPVLALSHYIFGADSSDTIAGGAFVDHLYGGGGNDNISGGGGGDYLEGGAGNDVLTGGKDTDTLKGGLGDDTYIFASGDGNDTIDDPFGRNAILVDQHLLQGGTKLAGASDFTSFDGTFDYRLSGADLLITDTQTGDTITIKDFQDGQFGIRLTEAPSEQQPAAPILTTAEPVITFANTQVMEPGTFTLSGDAGNDLLIGSTFGDLLLGDGFLDPLTTGDDELDGLEGDDDLRGGGGADLLLGGAGHDQVYGDAPRFTGSVGFTTWDPTVDGPDWLEGDIGDDVLLGGGGDDVLLGGTGQDHLWGDYNVDTTPVIVGTTLFSPPLILGVNGVGGNDWLDGGADDDVLEAGRGDDVALGGDGNDELIGDVTDSFASSPDWDLSWDGQDWLDGGAGDDVLTGGAGDDVLLGGLGNDQVFGDYSFSESFAGNDFLDGGAGDDFLSGDEGHDVLLGGADNDTLDGGDGNDVLEAGEGDDNLFGGAGDDVLTAGAGNDFLFGDNFDTGGNDLLDGGAGNDFLDGGDGDDELTGGEGMDLLSGGVGNDFLDGGDGDDTLDGGVDDDVLAGGSGNDFLDDNGGVGSDVLYGETGEDTVWAGEGDDLLYGGDGRDLLFGDRSSFDLNPLIGGNDLLDGGDGDDELYGEDGADILLGRAGNDLLIGGTGDDTLDGGAGNDTYVFNSGDGHDTITDTVIPGDGNTLSFGSGISLADLTLTQDADQNALTIQVGGSGDTVQLLDFDLNNVNGTAVVQTLAFADGSQAALADLLPLPEGLVNGTEANDVVRTGPGDDVIQAFDGDDTVDAGAGDDILIGGLGNDTLTGGAGNDTFVFNTGDGVDHIEDTATTDEGNALVFGEGITPDSLSLGLGSLLIQVGNNGDAIHIESFDPNDAYGPHAVDTFQFSDGTVLSYSQLIDRGFDLAGTVGDDTIVGTNVKDRITGLAGNDLLIGGLGHDTYLFNSGDGVDMIQDTAAPGEGNRILFGAGITAADLTLTQDQNMLIITYGVGGDAIQLADFDPNNVNGSLVVQTLQFADDSTFNLADLFPPTNVNHAPTLENPITDQSTLEDAAFSLQVPADTFADVDAGDALTLSAALDTGNPLPAWLAFDATTRTFSGTPEDNDVGALNVTMTATDSGGLSVADTFALTVTPAPVHVQVGTNRDDVITGVGRDDIDARGGDDLVRAGVGSDTVRGGKGDDQLFGETGDDTLYGNKGDDLLDGGAGDDFLKGGKGDDILLGGTGDDTLRGGKGKDTLQGGPGDDVLDTGKGEDTILFGRGDGHDTLVGRDHNHSDTIEFGPGVAIEHLWFQKSGNDLFVSVLDTAGPSDQLTIADWYTDKKHRVDEFQTIAGAELEAKRVDQLVQAMAAFAPPALGPDMTLPPDIHQQLAPVLAAAWEHGHS